MENNISVYNRTTDPNLYRPLELKIISNKTTGGFKIVDPDLDTNELATILEFNPCHSDLPVEMVRELAKHIINVYNTLK